MSIYLWILALIPSVLSSLWTSDIVRKCNYKLLLRKKLAGRFGRYYFVRGDKFLSAISFGLPARACEHSRSCSCHKPKIATTFEKMRDVAFCLVSSYRRFKHEKEGKETISKWARAYKLSLSTVGSQSSFNMHQWAEAAAFLVFLREQGYLNSDEFPETCTKVFPGTKGRGYRFFDLVDKFSESVPSEASAAQAESELSSMTTDGSPEFESLKLQAERTAEAAREHAASNKLDGSSILEKFEILKKECETWVDAQKDYVDCKSSISSVNVAGKGWITVKRTPDAPNGAFGVVYPTDDRNLVIKISKYEGLCNEIAALQALDGLGGFTPKIYPLDRSNPGIRTHCLQRVIVMDAVGDKTFVEIRAPSVKDTYTRLGKLLEAIKTLHATGISHGDLHGRNIRVNSTDPSKVFLVDFGLVEKGINEEDLPELCSRAVVPHQQTDTIVKNFCIATGVGVTDSDFWIALFRRLGADPNGLDDATRSAVEKIKQESVATLLGRVNQLLKELSPENGQKTKDAIIKLKKTPTARLVETEIKDALAQARNMIITRWRLIDLTRKVVVNRAPVDLDELKENFAVAKAALAEKNPTNDPGIAAFIQKLIREMEDKLNNVQQNSSTAI